MISFHSYQRQNLRVVSSRIQVVIQVGNTRKYFLPFVYSEV